MSPLTRLLAAGAIALASLGLAAVPASANDHLSHSTENSGAVQRGFTNPVAGNPSGTSGAAADPTTVPGAGDPNDGHELGTPSVDLSLVCVRSGRC
jgi:hypothetical protein